MAATQFTPPPPYWPASNTVVPGSAHIPGQELPQQSADDSIDVNEAAQDAIDALNKAIQSDNLVALLNTFLADGYWRDHQCLAWDQKTYKGRAEMVSLFAKSGCHVTSFSVDASTELRAPGFAPMDVYGKSICIQFFVNLTTKFGKGRGIAKLVKDDSGSYKIISLFTSLESLHDHGELTGLRRPQGVEHDGKRHDKNWKDRRSHDKDMRSQEPTVLVIGAGQAGLTIGARLKMLGVESLIIDRQDRIGDSWRNRYHQLVLHDPVWYDHLPYLNFPAHWPIFTPKDKMADFFETYVSVMELNVWTKSNLKESIWEDDKKNWTVTIDRVLPDGTQETRTFHPKHVIQATGHSGKINMPQFKGMENFKGDLLCHSSQFKGADPASKGKKAVVVGSCNSGHDIAQDFYSKGYNVTMVQRSSTCVVSNSSILDIEMKGVFCEGGPPVEDADLISQCTPAELAKTMRIGLTRLQNENDKKTLEGLDKAGFKVDMGPDSAGLFFKYLSRGGGYYIDVGASQLIVDGHIKVKQGQEIAEILPHGVHFADGSELDADEIVLATGYENMRDDTRRIFGDEVADRVGGNVWGFDESGEIQMMWRPTGHPGFWFMGGNLAMCRYFSRLLALHIKAIEEGITR